MTIYYKIINKEMLKNEYSNIPLSIENKLEKKLHNRKNHPIEIIKNNIYKYFESLTEYNFSYFDNLSEIVSIEDNFDKLLIPKDHPARKKSDSYYVNENYVLRTHTSAHQNELLSKGFTQFIVTGDVYRKDEIDSHHYPIFHQMELLSIIDDNKDPEVELKKILSGLVEYLFPNCEYRYNNDYFPFTHPSYEIEVKYMNKWMEILGCGVVQPKILENNNIFNKKAIAFGLGLDRLAMIFSEIPDIRYLWSEDEKFINQYVDGKLNKFKPFSKLQPLYKDVSFYINYDEIIDNKWVLENDFFELIRDSADDLLEEVRIFDTFDNKKNNKKSHTYRLKYSPNDPKYNDPGKFNDISNDIQSQLLENIKNKLKTITPRF